MARRKGSSGRTGRLYVPGVWSGVIREVRDREASSLQRFLGDPREIFWLDGAELTRLMKLARSDAEQRYAQRCKNQEPVTVEKVVLRTTALGVPKNELLQILRDSSLSCVSVHPDDTIRAVEDPL